MISLVLVGAIMTLLLTFFKNSMKMDRKMDELRKDLYSRQHFQVRLSQLFSSIAPRSSLPSFSGSSFHTSGEDSPALVAIFDNGIDPDPSFSGAIIGKIYLEKDGNLFLLLEPLNKDRAPVYRKELLFKNVENLEFQFLAKRSPGKPDPGSYPFSPHFEWRNTWPKNRWDIPSLIRVMVKQNGSDLGFAFSLPFAELITYEKLPPHPKRRLTDSGGKLS